MDKSKLDKALLAEMLGLKENTQAEIKPDIKKSLPIKEKLPLDDTGSELKSLPEYERLRAYIDVHFNLYRWQSMRTGWPIIKTPLECVESLLRLAIIENDENEIKKCFRAMELIIRENIKNGLINQK